MTGDDPGSDADAGADGAEGTDTDTDTDADADADATPGAAPHAPSLADEAAGPGPALVLPESLRAAFKEPMGPVFTDATALLAEAGRPVVAVGDVVTAHLLRAGHEPAVAVVDGRTKRRAVTDDVARVLGDRAAVDGDGHEDGDGNGDADGDGNGDADGDGGTTAAEATGREAGTEADPEPDAGAESRGSVEPAEEGEGESEGEGEEGVERLDVRNAPGTVSRALVAALADAVGRPGPVAVRVDGEEDLATLPALLAAPPGAAVVYGQPDEGMVLVRVDDATRSRARELLVRMDGDADAVLAPLPASSTADGADGAT